MLNKGLLAAGVLAAIISVLIFSGRVDVGQKDKVVQGDVVIWGTIPDESVGPILNNFNSQAQTYRFTYKRIPENSFTNTLVSAIAGGTGPDMILTPSEIILENARYTYPYPVTNFPEKTYKELYVDGANVFWTPSGALALPLSAEPLVMFYNRTMLSKKGFVSPPVYWDELATYVPELVNKDSQGNFNEYAFAFGSYGNVPHMSDIAMSVVGQLGQVPVLPQVGGNGENYYNVLMNTPASAESQIRPLESVMKFAAQFSDPNKDTYTWGQYAGNAQDVFVAEKLALYIGYIGEEDIIKKRNPRIDFEAGYLPQTRGYNTFSTGLKLHGLAVLRTTKNPTVAFTVLQQLAGNDWGPKFSLAFGGYPAIRSLYANQALPEVMRRSALVAKTWYNIKPLAFEEYFASMLNDIENGRAETRVSVDTFINRVNALYNPR